MSIAWLIVAAACGGDGPDDPFATADDGPGVADRAQDVGLPRRTETWGARWADLDADRAPDLVVGRHLQQAASLLRNVGGRFEEIHSGTVLAGVDGHDCDVGDVDADGRVDLYCSVGGDRGRGIGRNQLWLQQPDGSFVERAEAYGVTDPYGRGRHVAFIDVDHDPYLDLFVGNDTPREDGRPSPNRLFLNDGGRRFREAPELGVAAEIGEFCARVGDVDGDGWDDLLVCGKRRAGVHKLHLYRNVEGRRFEDVAPEWGVDGRYNWDAVLADLDGDGRLDLATIDETGVRVQLQRDSRFAAGIDAVEGLRTGRALAAGDADGDGDVDLYAMQTCDGREGEDLPDGLLLNEGEGTSFTVAPVPEPEEGCGDRAIVTDVDDDGRVEFLALNGRYRAGTLQLLAVNRGR